MTVDEHLVTRKLALIAADMTSVEQLLDPNLRGKPIAVGGGVVLAASYEARAFGICGGMPTAAYSRSRPAQSISRPTIFHDEPSRCSRSSARRPTK